MSMIVKVKNTFINVEVHEELSRKERPRSWPLANCTSVPRGGAPLHLDRAQRGYRKKPTSRDRRIEVPSRRASADEVAPSINVCATAIVPAVAAPQATVTDTSLDTRLVAPKAVREGAWHLCNVALGVESRLTQEAFRDWSARPAFGLGLRGVAGKTTKASASAAVLCKPSPCSKIITHGCNADDVVKVVKYTLPDGADEKVLTNDQTESPPKSTRPLLVVPHHLACDSPSTVATHRRRRCLDNGRSPPVLRKPWRAWLPSSLVPASVVLVVALLCGCLVCVFQGARPLTSARVEVVADDHQALESTTLRSFDEAVEGVSGLMRRLDALQEHLERAGDPTTLAESRRLRKRFVELLHGLQAATTAGASLLRAAEDGRVYVFHKELSLYVARVEREFGISGPELHLRLNTASALGGRGILGTSSLGILEGIGSSTLASDQRTSTMWGTSAQPTSFARSRFDDRAARVGTPSSPVKSPRAEKAMRAIVEEMNRFAAFQPQLKGLPMHVFNEIASQAQQLDDVLFQLQRRGNELRGHAARRGFGAAHLEAEGQQFVVSLEKFVATQAAFMNEVEEVTRTGGARRLHGGYVAYRPKDLR